MPRGVARDPARSTGAGPASTRFIGTQLEAQRIVRLMQHGLACLPGARSTPKPPRALARPFTGRQKHQSNEGPKGHSNLVAPALREETAATPEPRRPRAGEGANASAAPARARRASALVCIFYVNGGRAHPSLDVFGPGRGHSPVQKLLAPGRRATLKSPHLLNTPQKEKWTRWSTFNFSSLCGIAMENSGVPSVHHLYIPTEGACAGGAPLQMCYVRRTPPRGVTSTFSVCVASVLRECFADDARITVP